MADEVEARRCLVDGVEVLERVTRREPEAQPVVRRHHVERYRPGLAGRARVVGGIGQALADDRRDDGQAAAQLVGHDARDFRALGRRQREDLARVAVGHHRDDACVTGEPRSELAQRWLVDAMIGGEGTGDGGDDAAVVVDRGHARVLLGRRELAPSFPSSDGRSNTKIA